MLMKISQVNTSVFLTPLTSVTFSCKSVCAHSCLALCNPMDCSLPGSSVHGILQVRILEWATISFLRGSSQPRDKTSVSCVSCIGIRGFLTTSNTWEALSDWNKELLSLNTTSICRGEGNGNPLQREWVESRAESDTTEATQ